MARPPPQSYLLRLWREQTGAPLRATLISVAQPAEQRHFATLVELYTYLREEADGHNDAYCTASQTQRKDAR